MRGSASPGFAQRRRMCVCAGRCAVAVLAVALAVCGCATTATTALPADAPLLRLPPASLGRSLALQQRLTVVAAGREQQFDVLVEADGERLQLALLSFGRTAARLSWDGRTLDETRMPGLPAALSAERILSELQLVLWPPAAIRGALPAGWALDADAQRRVLRHDGAAVVAVEFPAPDRAELRHLRDGYRLQILSLPLGAGGDE